MNKFPVLSILCLCLILFACAEETVTVENTVTPAVSETSVLATNTPVIPTDTAVRTKKPITCESEQNPCVTVAFYGEECLVEEPTDNQTGWFVFVFANKSEGAAKMGAGRLIENRAFKDLKEGAEKRPTVSIQPSLDDSDGIVGYTCRHW